MWDAFAKRGLGASAISTPIPQPRDQVEAEMGVERTDLDARPGFESALRTDEAEITFRAPAGVTDMQVFVGQHEARAVPVADTIEESQNIGDTASFVPGTFELLAQAPGYGAHRFTLTTAANQDRAVELPAAPQRRVGGQRGKASGDGRQTSSGSSTTRRRPTGPPASPPARPARARARALRSRAASHASTSRATRP
jgi:hypothetical protein